MPISPSRPIAKRRAAPAAESDVCIPCSTVPFGSLNLISLLAAIVCVLSVLVVLASLIIQVQQFQLVRLAQPAPAAARP